MPEYIYVASSTQFPGIVKIGRTDREVSERMSELSAENYGPSSHTQDVEWTAEAVVEVHDNTVAESAIHSHWAEIRVTPDRELFFAESPVELAEELASFTGGQLVVRSDFTIEVIDTLVDLGIDVAGIGVAARSVLWLINSDFFAKAPYTDKLREKLSKQSEVLSWISLVSLLVLAVNLAIILLPIVLAALILFLCVGWGVAWQKVANRINERVRSWSGIQ